MPRGYSLVESTGQRAATGHGGWPVTISGRTWGALVSRRRPRATDPGPAGDASYGVSFSVSASMGLLLGWSRCMPSTRLLCRIACLGAAFHRCRQSGVDCLAAAGSVGRGVQQVVGRRPPLRTVQTSSAVALDETKACRIPPLWAREPRVSRTPFEVERSAPLGAVCWVDVLRSLGCNLARAVDQPLPISVSEKW